MLRLTVVNTTAAASSIRKSSMKISSQKEHQVPILDSIAPIESGFEVWRCDEDLSPALQFSDFAPFTYGERIEQGQHKSGWIGSRHVT